MKKCIFAALLVLMAFPAQAAFKGATIYNHELNNKTISNAIPTMLQFDTEYYDEGGFYNPSYPTRLTIPAGVTAVRLTCETIWANNSTGIRQIVIKKNFPDDTWGWEGGYPGVPAITMPANSATTTDLHASTPVIPVEEGDIFECQVYQNSGSSLAVLGSLGSWFTIEAVDVILDAEQPGGGSGGSETSVFSKTMNTDAQGWNDDTLRGIINRAQFQNSAPETTTNAYVTLQGCAAEGFATNGAYICKKSGTYGCASAASQLKTVSGDATSFTVPSDSGTVQLYAPMVDDGTSDYVVSIQNSNSASDCLKMATPETGFKSYYKNNVNNDASNTSPSGYGDFGGSDANNKHIFVKDLSFDTP